MSSKIKLLSNKIDFLRTDFKLLNQIGKTGKIIVTVFKVHHFF